MKKADIIRDYLATIGQKGGQAGKGRTKARSGAQASAAARARWDRVKAAAAAGNNNTAR
jgi:hypothetical protein